MHMYIGTINTWMDVKSLCWSLYISCYRVKLTHTRLMHICKLTLKCADHCKLVASVNCILTNITRLHRTSNANNTRFNLAIDALVRCLDRFVLHILYLMRRYSYCFFVWFPWYGLSGTVRLDGLCRVARGKLLNVLWSAPLLIAWYELLFVSLWSFGRVFISLCWNLIHEIHVNKGIWSYCISC